jgi:hypothetical protein
MDSRESLVESALYKISNNHMYESFSLNTVKLIEYEIAEEISKNISGIKEVKLFYNKDTITGVSVYFLKSNGFEEREIIIGYSDLNKEIKIPKEIKIEKLKPKVEKKILCFDDLLKKIHFDKSDKNFNSIDEAFLYLNKYVNDSFIDNYRSTYTNNEKGLNTYFKSYKNGCCGFCDLICTIKNKQAIIGCNYGH